RSSSASRYASGSAVASGRSMRSTTSGPSLLLVPSGQTTVTVGRARVVRRPCPHRSRLTWSACHCRTPGRRRERAPRWPLAAAGSLVPTTPDRPVDAVDTFRPRWTARSRYRLGQACGARPPARRRDDGCPDDSGGDMAGRSYVRRMFALPRTAWVIYVGMFLIKLANFLNVFLVLYLTARGYGPALAGAALAAVGIGNFVGNVVGGSVADRVGRRATIVASMFGYGTSVAVVPLTADIWLIIALVSVVGFFAQLYRPAAGAMLVDVLPAEQRVLGFAVLRLAINVGMAIGPAAGGLVGQYSYTYIFLAEAVASLTFGVLALLALRETRPEATVAQVATTDTRDGST